MIRISGTARRTLAACTVVVAAGSGIGSVALASSGSAQAAVPACNASDLGAWVAVDQGNGAAGTIYYPLELTNLSGRTCTLHGFPGVAATGANGHQLGSAAFRDYVSPVRTVVLAPGATAHALLGWSDAEVTTAPGCHPVQAFELSIIPPNQRTATHAAFSVRACSRAGAPFLKIGPVEAGVGTIYTN
jgi:Protein of unknown function (DUF4232)